MTELDKDGVEFDPAIHAVKKDGTPKKTPQGTWALLVEDKPVVVESADMPQEKSKAAQPDVASQVARALGARLVHDGGNHVTIERNGQQISVNTAKGAEAAIKSLRRCGW